MQIYDHLGSVRVMYQTDNNCQTSLVNYTLLSANDYMAFGKTLRSFNNTGKYAYQGSEKDKELGDNNYYTHYRELEVEGRMSWEQVDPKMDEQMNWSSYVSMNDNPVILTDPDGDYCIPCITEALALAEASEAGVVAEEGIFAARIAESFSTLSRNVEFVGRIAKGGSWQSQSIEGKDIAHPDVLQAKKNGGIYYDAYLLNKYHPREYPTLAKAFELLEKAQRVLKAEKTDVNTTSNEKTVNPKKAAREAAREKKEGQPASEDYAKYKAKEKEKAEGKDARRQGHDAKDKIGKDRTKKELDEDYKTNR